MAPKAIREQSKSLGWIPRDAPCPAELSYPLPVHGMQGRAFLPPPTHSMQEPHGVLTTTKPHLALLSALRGRKHLFGAKSSILGLSIPTEELTPQGSSPTASLPRPRCSTGSIHRFGVAIAIYTYIFLFFFLPFLLKSEARNSIATHSSQGLTPAL